MKWLSQCTKQEQLILSAIIALANMLDGDLTKYAGALADLNRKHFGVHGPSRNASLNPMPGSLAISREVRAAKRYGQ